DEHSDTDNDARRRTRHREDAERQRVNRPDRGRPDARGRQGDPQRAGNACAQAGIHAGRRALRAQAADATAGSDGVATVLTSAAGAPARNIQVSTTVSGLSEMLVIPRSASHRARSGWSDGPCPQIPTYLPALRHATIAMSSIALTASSRSSNVAAIGPPESRS